VTALQLARRRLFAQLENSTRHSLASGAAAMLGRAQIPGRAELAKLRPATRFLIMGLIGWIVLVAFAAMTAMASVEMSTMNFPSWFGSRASASPATALRSSATFENILQRSLFSRSRQAAVAAALVTPPSALPVAQDRGVTLKGVFINGTLAKAYVTSAQNPLGVWVSVNDEIAGWRVVAVKPDQVILDGRNEKLAIPLGVDGSAK
jgi:hypothetical protein